MVASLNKIKYNNEYNKTNYRHIHLIIKKELYCELKKATQKHSISTNSFITLCIEKELNSENDK